MKKNLFLKYIGLLIGVLNIVETSSYASALKITPMSLELSSGDMITTLKVTNVSDEPVVLQTEVKDWEQENNEDIHNPTKDIVISPPLIKIGSQEQQIFRLAVRKKKIKDKEIAYRIYLTEVPQSIVAKKNTIQTLLSLSLPLFIKPDNSVESPPLWSIARGEKGIIKVGLLNQGNEHLKITKIKVQTAENGKILVEQEILDYILPLKKKEWSLKIPPSFKGSEVFVCVETNKGEISQTLHLPVS